MSAMITTCPNCKLQLALTATDLRIGQGHVRCGRCDRVFNALISLSEIASGEAAPEAMATGTAAPPPAPPPQDASTQDAAPPEAPPQDAPPGDTPLPPVPEMPDDVDVVETVGTGTFETIVLEGDGMSQTEEHVDASEIDRELQLMAARIEAVGGLTFPDEEHGQDISEDVVLELTEPLDLAAEEADITPLAAKPVDIPASGELIPQAPHLERVHWRWKAAAALLVLALLLQLVHQNRRELVSTAWAGPVVRPAYAAFGHALEPDWVLADYTLRQLGGEAPAFARDQLVVRASVQNRARWPQPPPVLRVTLKDRFGNALATHDVAPQDYLRQAPPARLAPDQRLDAELVLADPGGKAAGFELDACLPGSDTRLHCAGAP